MEYKSLLQFGSIYFENRFQNAKISKARQLSKALSKDGTGSSPRWWAHCQYNRKTTCCTLSDVTHEQMEN